MEEPLVKRCKKKIRKINYKIPDEMNDHNKDTETCKEMESMNNIGVRSDETDVEITPNTVPSAPPEEEMSEYTPTGLQNNVIRSQFLQKVYATLMTQITFSNTLIVIFVKVPHLRKVFRKNIFDKLFLTSYIGLPLCVFMALALIFPSLRRRFAFLTMILLTACLSLLISYAITDASAYAFLYSMASSDICCLTAIVASKRVDFTSWKTISSVPLFMVVSSCLAPSILHIPLKNTIVPSIFSTALMTYLSANTRPVIRHNDLELEPHEYLYATTQLYMNPERAIKHKIKSFFGNNRNRNYSAI